MWERRREWIKDTFYGDYTALLFTLHAGSRWVDVATRQWDGEMEDMTSHTSGSHTVSFPRESSHLSCAAAPPDHSTPPHKELTNTDAKQGLMSLWWQVGSMGAWGGEMVRAEMESHNSNKRLGLLKNTEGLGEWMREEERMRNMWYFNKRYQGRSWWFRDSCLLKSETFFNCVPQPVVQVVFSCLSEALFCVFTFGFVFNVLASSVNSLSLSYPAGGKLKLR